MCLIFLCFYDADPILPKHLYARVLGQMLSEVEIMKAKSAGKLATEAEGHFLNTLLDWGTTRSLHEHSKLYQQACQNLSLIHI